MFAFARSRTTGRASSAPLGSGRLLQLPDLAFEVREILEALVDRGEPQVRNRIEPTQALEDRHADAIAGNLAARGAHLLLDVGDDGVDRRFVEAATRRAFDTGADLRAIERLGEPRALAHEHRDFLDPFVRGVAAATRETFTPAADRDRVLDESRIDDLVVVRAAVRTTHTPTVTGADVGRAASRVAPFDRLAGHDRAATVTGVDDRVDDHAGIAIGGDLPRDRPERVARLDDYGPHVREALGGGEGRPLERGTRTRHRHHEAHADQRSQNPPSSQDSGPRASSGRPRPGLTVGPGRVARPGRIDETRIQIEIEFQNGRHRDSFRAFVVGIPSSFGSNQRGETSTFAEHVFGVKGISNGCLPRTCDRVTVRFMATTPRPQAPRPKGRQTVAPTVRATLTDRQRQVLEYIDDEVGTRGYPPSVREIGEAVGLSSPSTVHAHLAALQDKGYLRRDPTKPRAIEVALEPITGAAVSRRPVRHVPLLGDVAAGTGVLAAENVEELLPLPADLTGDGELFMLRVRGDSMIDAGIFTDDYVVARAQSDADNGDIVIAGIPGEEATVKTFLRKRAKIVLRPANDDYEDLVFDPADVRIYGKVVTLLRRF